jgi:hypothetical protein
MQQMACPRPSGQNLAGTGSAILLFPLLSHHPHPRNRTSNATIGTATMQAFKSLVIRRERFIESG